MYCYQLQRCSPPTNPQPSIAEHIVQVARSCGHMKQMALFQDEQTGRYYLLTTNNYWLQELNDTYELIIQTPPRLDTLEWQAGLLLWSMASTKKEYTIY